MAGETQAQDGFATRDFVTLHSLFGIRSAPFPYAVSVSQST